MARDRDDERIRRDTAGIGPDPGMTGRLYRLGDRGDFRVATGEPDVRGWEVRTLAGAPVGEVDDLLIDPQRGEVVMLEVDLNDSNRHLNVPLRGVQLDREHRIVVVDSGDLRDAEAEIEERALDEHETDRDPAARRGDEIVLERRPVVVEETVVRRRMVDDGDVSPEDIRRDDVDRGEMR